MTDKTLTLDEAAALAARAAIARGYPEDLAGLLSEMVVWLERHGLPGLASLADRLEQAAGFDVASQAPRILEDGRPLIAEPLTGGMFLHENFGQMKDGFMVDGPETGTLLMAPFVAMAAQQGDTPVQIAFLGTREDANEAARITYRNGKSKFEGRPAAVLGSRTIAIEVPRFIGFELDDPANDAILAADSVCQRLETLAGPVS